MKKVAYLALDVHAENSVLGIMDFDGKFLGNQSFTTSEQNIINALKVIKVKTKDLALEESTLAYWAAQVAAPYVTEVISCDPKENALIYKSKNKNDKVDTLKLCRLLRLGELKKVYHPENDERAVFKASIQHYLDIRDQQVSLKQKIKAMYRHWGVVNVKGESVYHPEKRHDFLKLVKHYEVKNQLNRLYAVMDKTEAMQKAALKSTKLLGRNYPEIKEFKKIPGVGDICAHVFDAFIQTPDRFSDKRKVWRYCRLGITDRSSDGKPLGFKRLDRSGVPELKAMSYRIWMSAMKGDNEVKQFYKESLRRTHSRIHARLNTQRKIIAVMYGIWKRRDTYSREKFLNSSDKGVA